MKTKKMDMNVVRKKFILMEHLKKHIFIGEMAIGNFLHHNKFRGIENILPSPPVLKTNHQYLNEYKP